MSKAIHAVGSLFSGSGGPSAPAPLPPDDSEAKAKAAQAQADAARDALLTHKAAGRSGLIAAGENNAYSDQMDLMAKKAKRTASADLVG